MSLSDNEIMESLPFLAKYCKNEYNDIRVDDVLLGAFDLINRLQRKVKAFEQGNVQLREELKETTEKFNCQQYVYTDLSDIIREKNAEIEKLQADYSSMQSTLAKMSMGVEQAKAEAIKEFAEKVKTLFFDGDEVIDEIDNLVKEMAGDAE